MGVKQLIASHLRQPKGLFGKFIGRMMNRGNDDMNRFTIGLLDIEPGDSVLEIGFGNGKYIHEIARDNRAGFVAGIDYSETMVEQARKRNKAFIDNGRVDIKLAQVNSIPFQDEMFEKVFTVNTIYFWSDPVRDLQEVYRILKPGGRFAVSFRSKERMERLELNKHGFTLYEPEEVRELVAATGFSEVTVETRPGNWEVYCVVAVKAEALQPSQSK